ncbi:hypothetical protein [Herpetosiphon geysericola]|uniref:Uncharacterized protein n=1 Tax=Herpetosiphon geysericola TaxID=70996 RepID=A0A0P6YDX3_9CHLR|nr:hypothetical protein [Herpetosiphon geysericola]KPL80231.1 hypothetical protein SE18_24565 [Herpetosiphon geysericola]
MAYATKDEFRAYKLQPNGGTTPIPTTDDLLITRLLGVAQAEIDLYCHRSFEAVTTTRFYDEANARMVGQRLYLDTELLTVTSLMNGDGREIPLTGFRLEPRNEPPYTMITLKSSWVWFLNLDAEIAITGTWGYSATAPAPIQQATLELTAYLYDLRKQQNYDVTAMPELGQVVIPGGMPKHVKNLMAEYRRKW